MTSKSNRLAIDIGGTFTDVVLELSSEGVTSYASTKVLTTHTNPAEGVMLGVARVTSESDTPLDTIGLVIHGTTLATNAIIERKGARTAFLTTEGHRDVLGMAFENRFEQYDVNIERPEPLVPRYLRLPIPERISATGKVLVPLELDAVDKAIDICVKEDVTSIVIGFLHSYVNSTHEELVAERVRERISSISVTTSSSVCPEIREYERFTTACANGYVLPLMSRYLRELSDGLKQLGCDCPCLMMTSGGGLMSFVNAARFPVRLVESGPAGGAIMVSHLAESRDIGKVRSFEMGGTTAKICLIDEGEPQLSRSFEVDRRYRFKKGSGLPLRIPVIEMVEIGAGGGSIASIDALQRIQVGPESSRSAPGPACYVLGGTSATVTDGDVCDYDVVFRDLLELSEQYCVQEILYDPYNAEHLMQQFSEQTGIERKIFPQTIKHFAEPTKEFERLITNRELKIKRNDCWRFQASVVTTKPDANNNIRPIKPGKDSAKKIDGIVSAIMSLGGAMSQPRASTNDLLVFGGADDE